MDQTEIKERVRALPWRHSIDLGNGIVTPGKYPAELMHMKLAGLGLPEDLTGKSVIDIGANDGFYTFECERRGASRLLAVDIWDQHPTKPHEKACFDFAAEALGSIAASEMLDVEEFGKEAFPFLITNSLVNSDGFDVVLALGLIYHLMNPHQFLRQAFSLCNEMIIIETAIDMTRAGALGLPVLRFRPGKGMWPSVECVADMLSDVGFKGIETAPGVAEGRAVIRGFK